MSSGDVLRRLFSAHVTRDDDAFARAATEIIDEESAKNHRLLADDLRELIQPEAVIRRSNRRNGRSGPSEPRLPVDREHGLPLLAVDHPELPWTRLIVPSDIESQLRKIVDENSRADLLATLGVGPTKRVLLYGPPGCGKTLAARVIAAQLDRPLLSVKLDAIVSSYLGQTAANLDQVFSFVETGSWVLLFDEFDAIAKDRGDRDEHGELKRVVSALLQMLDRYHGESLVIAATNHEQLLDSAVWRRFESIIQLSLPDVDRRYQILSTYMRALPHDERVLAEVAEATEGASGGDLELLAIDAVRRAALSLRTSVSRTDVMEALVSLRHRMAALGVVFS